MNSCSLDFCHRPTESGRKLCAGHQTQKRRGRPYTPIRVRTATPASIRYWSYVQVKEGCWGWSGATDSAGYASIGESMDGRWTALKAHRVLYELRHGAIPDGMEIDHECRTRSCTNPDHLRLVTQKQNQENRSGANRNSRSGVRGVSWDSRRRKWVGAVVNNRTVHHVGQFDSLAQAEQAVSASRRELFTHSSMDD